MTTDVEPSLDALARARREAGRAVGLGQAVAADHGRVLLDALAFYDESPVAAALAVQQATTGAELCALGYHAWVRWLPLDNGSWVTWCVREGCEHKEQFDA